jgi:hypothetical protein
LDCDSSISKGFHCGTATESFSIAPRVLAENTVVALYGLNQQFLTPATMKSSAQLVIVKPVNEVAQAIIV